MKKTAGLASGSFLLATFFLGFASCGGGGGGASGGGAATTTNSTETSSGSLGVFISNGNATVAAPSGATSSSSSSGNATVTPSSTAYLVNLSTAPNPSAYTTITCNGVSNIGGINLDTQHSVGVAFDTKSYTLGFFTFAESSPITVSGCATMTLPGSLTIDTSAGSTDVGGGIMDPSIQTAIVETGSGFQFVDYSNPSSPALSSVYATILSFEDSPSKGIDIVENFAYDPYLVVGGVSYKMILSGSGAVSYAAGKSDGNLLELADINTGTIYRPDSQTKASFPIGTINGCSADAIGVDTAYQVAIIGCEYDGLTTSTPSTFSQVTVLVNLNALTLTPSSGTYSLPSSAISSVTLTNSAPPQNNIFVDSVNHIVMWGDGGDWGSSGSSFSVAKLSDPFTSFGNGIVGGAAIPATMPAFSSSNTIRCSVSGCAPLPTTSWSGYGYPHGSAMYVDSSGNSVALWMNQSASFLAMVKANEFLSGVPSNAVTYVGIP